MFRCSERIEAFIFCLGCCLFASELVALSILWFVQHELALKIAAVITASILSGRTASILTGQELGLHSLSIILLLSIWNSSMLFFFLPLIVTFSHNVKKLRFLGNMLESTRKTAEVQRSRIRNYGPWGLPVFVWLPFPWTGALVGALVGLLIGMSVKRALLIVIPSMVGGVVSWVFGFRQLFVLTGVIGKTICIILIVVMLLFPFLRVLGVTGKAQS
jgi:uncharacterized membrane protein